MAGILAGPNRRAIVRTFLARVAVPGIVAGSVAIGLLPGSAFAGEVHVTADFGVSVDYPLVKTKFAVFNSGMVRPDHYARDINLYSEVHPDAMRIDLGWGARWIGWKPEPVSGTAGNLHYDFREMDRIAGLLQSQNVLACWSYCYTPVPLQPKRGAFTATPTDLEAWASVLKTMTEHYRHFPGGDPVGYHEVGNEPDNRDFFTGGLDSYLKMYQLGSAAIREGNPDAMVGGPALAFSNGWIDPFLDTVVDKHLPLDFYSFHFYPGCPYTPADLHGVVKLMVDALDKRPELRTTEMHLNEFNSFKIDYPRRGSQDRTPIATAFLHDVAYFLTQPALTRVYWAQFQDSGGGNFSGMIDIDGHRKALFNAYAAYARMPIDRNRLTIEGAPGIEGFASSDEHRRAVLLWNRSGADQRLTVDLGAVGFAGNNQVFRIDIAHASHGDQSAEERLVPEKTDDVKSGQWIGELPVNGIVLIEHVDDSKILQPDMPSGRIVRELHDYSNRDSAAYADFDRNTWTVRLGLAGDKRGVARAGFTADGLSESMVVETVVGGRLGSGIRGMGLEMRVDYQTKTGYTSSVVYHGPLGKRSDLFQSGSKSSMPWGTKKAADAVNTVKDFSHFTAAIKQDAPVGWTGRVQVSFALQDASPNDRVVIRLRR